MTFTPFEVLCSLCVIAMLVMNLRVGMSVAALKAEFKSDLGQVVIQVERLRAEHAKEQAELLKSLMGTLASGFGDGAASTERHNSNTKRIDAIDARLAGIDQRIADIA